MKIFLLLILFVACFGCQPVYHGYQMQNIDTSNFVIGSTSKNEVQKILGTPSFSNVPCENTICYMQGVGTKVLFLRFANPQYHLVCFKFDNKSNILLEIIEHKELKPKKVDVSGFEMNLNRPN